MLTGRVAGFGLIALSLLLYAVLVVVPFVPLSAAGKVALSSAVVIAGEVAFWAGGLLLGKELVSKYRAALDPRRWFCR